MSERQAALDDTKISTIVSLLRHVAETSASDVGLHFLGSAARSTDFMAYVDLDRHARAIATSLRDFSGERALILFPPGAEYIKAFFGCLYAGIVAVPAYPPNPNRIHRSQERILGMVRDGHINLLLTTPAIAMRQDQYKELDPIFEAIEWRTLEDIDAHLHAHWTPPHITEKTTAFLQYTSGSTGTPKGVVVSHGNLLHNQTLIKKSFGTTKQDKGLSWLPLYHDMGLIGSLMQPIFEGIPSYLMSPVDFLRRPLRWLETIEQHQITISGGPNFAFDLCVSKLKAMAQPPKLDLSSWRVAFNGAEPVRPESMEAFIKAFEPYGFNREALLPCYGLAEATLIVAGSGYQTVEVDSKALEQKGIAKKPVTRENRRTLVAAGQVYQDVTIVDPRTLKGQSEGQVGEIWLRSPSVAGGYFNRSQETYETFNAKRSDQADHEYMRTGDLGFLRGDQLYVTGRLKDLIIIRGRNLYPQDIETTAREAFETLKDQACAAFSQSQNDQELLVVVQEIHPRSKMDPNQVIDTIREDIVEQHEVQASTVVLVKAGSIPRTSSGKVRRKATAALLKEGSLEIIATHSRLPGELTRRAAEDNSPMIEAILQTEDPQERKHMASRYIRRVLTELLGSDSRQINDKMALTALGLDSLNEVALQHRLETDLNLLIQPGDLRDGLTIGDLIDHIVNGIGDELQQIPFKAKALNPYGRHPLSQGQLSLWGSIQKVRNTAGLHIARLVKIEGPFNAMIFKMSLDYIVARQGMMRACLSVHHGEPFQQLNRNAKPVFLELDVSHWDPGRLDAYFQEESLRNFDEEVMPRFYLLKHHETSHSLLMVWHHITADLWSLVGFLKSFKQVYEALQQGKSPSLPTQEWQYTDFVHWQERMLAGEPGERLWRYWSQQLKELPDPMVLPHDFNGQQRKDGQSNIAFSLDSSWTAKAQALAKNSDTTLFAVTLTVFGVLLYRYSGQERFLVGAPFAGRSRAWQASMVGYFVNMLPLLMDFDGNPRFSQALERTRKTVRGAFENQDFPLNLMIERLCPERDPHTNPFFDIAFAYQSLPPGVGSEMAPFAVGAEGASLSIGPLKLKSEALRYSASQFQFSVSVVEDGQGCLRGMFEYKSEYYEHATMERLMQHYLMLLKGFLEGPNQRVLDVPLLTREEMNRVLLAWRHDDNQQLEDRCLHELVSAKAKQQPNETALIFGNRHYTYAEFESMANQFAITILGEIGQGEAPIAICLERRPHLMIAMLAVWKAGRAFVALEPAHPLAHRKRIVKRIEPALLICETQVEPELAALATTLHPDSSDDMNYSDAVCPSLRCFPEQLAVISFTADPKGIPRGVLLSHKAIAGTASALSATPGFRSGDRMPAITTPSHDAAILEMFLPLWVGGTTILMTRRAATDGALLAAALERHGASALQATTATFQLLLSTDWKGHRDLRMWCDLETLEAETASALLELGPSLQGLFGASETASWASVSHVTQPDALELGTGLGQTQLYVLSRQLQLVPRGGVGGLYIAGNNLAQGYFKRPGITAARFIPNPFSDQPGARMFFTRSLAHILDSGKFALEGRTDSQVSIRGFRVEPGEVKAQLLNHHEISEAHVRVQQDKNEQTKLIAYVVPMPGRALSPPLLRKYLETSLPTYMAPAHFVVMGRLPRNAEGKLETRALPDLMSGFMAPDYVPPRNALEQVLAEMWAEALGVSQVGIHDNFFELGGHSLIAAKITARIRQFFQVELPLREFFANRCVEDQAVRIAELRAGSSASVLPLKPFNRGKVSPVLSYSQKRLWFLQHLEPESGMFNIGLSLDLIGKLDVQSLRKSIHEIVERHETLRSRFPAKDDQPICRIMDKMQMPLPIIDLSQQYDVTQAREEALRLGKRMAQQAFDLERVPGLRLGLFRLSAREHIMSISVHQMVADLWSLSLFVKELQVLYSRHCGLTLNAPPDIGIQYGDYAVWERRLYETNSRAKQLEYWHKRLGDELPKLELPTDFSRGRAYHYAAETYRFAIPKQLLNAVNKLAREANTTRFIILLSAYMTLLQRYTNAEDLTVGTLVANRIRTETEHLIGAFSNTIVLRADMSGDPTVTSLLRRIRQIALAAYDHQDLPFEKLLESLNPERDLTRSPLFQVAFGVRDLPMLEFEITGLKCRQLNQPRQIPRCDLILEIGQEKGWIHYNAELFNEQTIAVFSQRYLFLLESMLADPELPLSQLTLEAGVAPSEPELTMVSSINADRFQGINTLLSQHAKEQPHHKAVVSNEASMTYGELEDHVARVAAALRAEGVCEETPVSVCLPPGSQLFVAMLAIQRTGGYYMPLDPKYPVDRLTNMLSISGCKLVIGQPRESFNKTSVRILKLIDLIAQKGLEPLPAVPQHPDLLAYVVFTSGSTGLPKGIAVSKRAALNHALSVRHRFQLTAKDRIMQFFSISFDASLAALFGSIAAGSTYVIPPFDGPVSSKETANFIEKQRVSVVNMPTALYRDMVNDMHRGHIRFPDCLRMIMIAGEKASEESVLRLPAVAHDGLHLKNAYGPSETANLATCADWNMMDILDGRARAFCIGTPWPNYRCYVLDRHAHPVPRGIPGQLWISGLGVARGYLNNPGLTAERFLPDLYADPQQPGQRMYRTGDRVRLLNDNQIEFLSRFDRQVKIRGYRIEPADIEAVLDRHPMIDHVVVEVQETERERRLVSFIQPFTNIDLEEPDLQPSKLTEFARSSLPPFMVPADFVVMRKFPLNPNGKVDRRALPFPAVSQSRTEDRQPPQTTMERMLARIWCDVLGLANVCMNDSFFDLGGHSLMAAKLVSRIRDALHIDMPLKVVFEHAVLREQARFLEQERLSHRGIDAPPLRVAAKRAKPTLSFSQERLWYMERLEPGSAGNNVAICVRMRGKIDKIQMIRSFETITSRHEILRTYFKEGHKGPQLKTETQGQIDFRLVDMTHVGEEQREHEVALLCAEESRIPFYLEALPLMRIHIFLLDQSYFMVLLVMHRMIADYRTAEIVMREFALLYHHALDLEAAALPKLTLQHHDFAHWQREWLHGQVLDAQLGYWERKLAWAPDLELPLDFERPPMRRYRGKEHYFNLNSELTARLHQLARVEGMSNNLVVLTGYVLLLSRYAGQSDFCVGMPATMRNDSKLENIAGPLANLLTLRVNTGGHPTFGEMLGRLRRELFEVHAHQDVPFELVLERIQPDRDLSRPPIFQVMFDYQEFYGQQDEHLFEMPELVMDVRPVDYRVATYDMALTVRLRDGELHGVLDYNTDLFEETTIARLLDHYKSLLEDLAREPDVPADRLAMVDGKERRDLSRMSGFDRSYHHDHALHTLFEKQVTKAPHATALVRGGEQKTYGQLNLDANRLAYHLLRLQQPQESVIALCLPSGFDAISAHLAVLKAGCCVFALDRALPFEHIVDAIKANNCGLVITDRRWFTEQEREVLGKQSRVLDLSALHATLRGYGTRNPDRTVLANQLAVLAYHRLERGGFNCIALTHRNLVHTVEDLPYAMERGTTGLQAAPLSAEVSLLEIWSTLLNGMRLVLVDHYHEWGELPRLVNDHGVHVMWMNTHLFHMLAEDADDQLQSLRRIFIGGDKHSFNHIADFVDQHPQTALIHCYGAPEACALSTHYEMQADDEQLTEAPLGKAIGNTHLYLLDTYFQPVPIGAFGQIFVSGEGLARGYAYLPHLTAERFLPNPFASEPGRRMFATGDMGRFRNDGAITYAGRIDRQIRFRGHRINLSEIEHALREHPQVLDAHVLMDTTEAGSKALIAYVEKRPGEKRKQPSSLEKELAVFLSTRLPAFTVPGVFCVMDALPMDANDHIDEAALPKPKLQQQGYVPPRNPIEEVVTRIWSQVLGKERMSITADFFENGGHSLAATRVAARIRNAFGVDIPVRTLFERTVLHMYAEVVVESVRGNVNRESIPSKPLDQHHEPNLSFSQERLWFLDRLDPGLPTYNIPLPIRLKGPLREDALEWALAQIMTRHELLRTRFALNAEGKAIQVVEPLLNVPLVIHDLRKQIATDDATAIAKHCEEVALEPFDLENAPLWRAHLLQLGFADTVLLLNVHHAITDGYSMTLLLRELVTFYNVHGTPVSPEVPELPIQFRDFAEWQRERWQAGDMKDQMAYWQEHLAGAPQSLDMHTDYPRPSVQTFKGAQHRFELDQATVEQLQSLCLRESVTLFMTLLGVYALLLSRYASQNEVAIGTPATNRFRGETESLIGFFVNTLVTRLSPDPRHTFGHFLHQVRRLTLDAFANQDVPFERLVEHLHPQRDMSRSPLFQAFFSLEDAQLVDMIAAAEMKDLKAELLPFDFLVAKFELSLTFYPHSKGLTGILNYNADLFQAETIARMGDHFSLLLRQILAQPNAKLSKFSLVSSTEKHQLRQFMSGPGLHLEETQGLHTAFERWAAETSENEALSFEDQHISYGDLDARANALAHQLIEWGIGREMPVALCLYRSIDMVVAMLATLKAGAYFVPLDPDLPSERLELLIRESKAKLMIGHSKLTLSDALDHVTLFQFANWNDRSQPAHAPRLHLAPGQACYGIFTSGTTGIPKLTVNTHAGVLNRIWWLCDQFEMNADDTFLQKTPYFFDVSIWEFFWPLSCGLRLVIARPEGHRDPIYLEQLVQAQRVTHIHFVPSMLHAFLEAADPSACTSLKRFFCSGEALSRELELRFFEIFNADLYNFYGPTEAAIEVTYFRCSPLGERHAVPIGKPHTNVSVAVVDQLFNELPVGVPGELLLMGVQLARGYEGRPDLTAQAFIPSPIALSMGARAYRTGDLVLAKASGNIEFLGRIDYQVKVRGYRIELGEIEAFLDRHQGISLGVVTTFESSTGDTRLAAYVLPDHHDPSTRGWTPERLAASLRGYLREHLPEYMVPNAVLVLETLPLLANGKINRRALPKPKLEDLTSTPYREPSGATEKRLAKIWSEVLNVQQIGALNNFFQLGGHSLLAAQLVARIREQFRFELSLKDIFRLPVLNEMAAMIEQAAKDASVWEPPIEFHPRVANEMPMSFAQERLWFINRLEPDNPAYNIPTTLRLTGALDRQVLEMAINTIVADHEPLRTHFGDAALDQACGGLQHIEKERNILLTIVDLKGLPAVGREQAALDMILAAARRPFDLTTGPLLRVHLYVLDDHDHLLLINMHHIVSDGWSLKIFFRGLLQRYDAILHQNGDPHHPPDVQYADYAIWQRTWLAGGALKRQLDFWCERLEGAPEYLDLNTDFQRPAVLSSEGGSYTFRIEPELSQRFHRFCQDQGVTLYMGLLSLFSLMLAKLTRVEDLCIGSPTANRSRTQVEQLIGFFVNALVLRLKPHKTLTFADYLQQVRDVSLDSFAHQDVPFERLVDALVTNRDMSRAPLFQVVFAFENLGLDPNRSAQSGGLDWQPLHVDYGIAKLDLYLHVSLDEQGFAGIFTYAADLFEAKTMALYAERLETLMHAVLAEPDVPLARLRLLPEKEQAVLINQWNSTTVDYPIADGFHQMFEARVQETPNAPAIICGSETLTYATLNRHANQLARYLRQRGVGRDAAVGLCLNRKPHMLVAMIAIFKAGAAYVPLDPNYPPQRLAHMMRSVGMHELITDADLMVALKDSLGIAQTLGIEPILIDDHAYQWANLATVDLNLKPDPQQLAYVIFTSGSTGLPKGVGVPQSALVNHIFAVTDVFEFSSRDRVLQFSSISFDQSVRQLFPILWNGGGLVLPEYDQVPTPNDLLTLVEKQNISVLILPTAYWHQMVEDRDLREGLPACLRLINVGGEKASPIVLKKWLRLGKVAWINAYGPTEATINTTHFTVNPTRTLPAARLLEILPIGIPYPNYQTYLLDPEWLPVPIGEIGEVFIGGAGLARGYLNHPAATAEKYIPNPFATAEQPGSRLYKTGDLARYIHSGDLVFAGRVDRQVKIRGFRVELAEIESHVRALEDVAAVAMKIWPGASETDQKMVSYLQVAEAEQQAAHLQPQALREHLQQKLPAFMVPSDFVLMASFPLTPNGKVDVAKLPEPQAVAQQALMVEPLDLSPTQEMIAHIWSEILGVSRIAASDNFFDLGGHSLMATRVTSRIRKVFDIEFPLRLVFECEDLAELAEAVQTRIGAQQEDGSIKPRSRPKDITRFPVTFGQERMWFTCLLNRPGFAYNVPIGMRLEGKVHLDALKDSFATLYARHEVLRARIVMVDGELYQQFHDAQPFAVTQHSFRDLSKVDRETAAMAQMTQDAQVPIDPVKGPLMRVALYTLDDQHHFLLMLIHHTGCDGWSLRVILRELTQLYGAQALGQDPLKALPELKIRYADYAAWQRENTRSPQIMRQKTYWRSALQDVPAVLKLPKDRPRPQGASYRGECHEFRMDAEFYGNLRQLCADQGVTVFMATLAAYAVLLSRFALQDHFVIGSPVANRHRREIEDTVGLFINRLAMVMDLRGAPTFTEVLQRVRDRALKAYVNQDVPVEHILEDFIVPGEGSATPLFQVFCSPGNTDINEGRFETDLAGTHFRFQPIPFPVCRYDMTLRVFERYGQIMVRWDFDTDLFDAQTIETMAQAYVTLLHQVVAKPTLPIDRIPLLDQQHEAALPHAASQDIVLEHDYSVVDYIQAHVRASGKKTAFFSETDSLTYSALARRIKALSQALRQLGCGDESPVAIVSDRFVDYLIGSLAVLKIGGTVVPLDREKPKRVLKGYIKSLGVSVVISQDSFLKRFRWQSEKISWLNLDESAADTNAKLTPHPPLTLQQTAMIVDASSDEEAPQPVAISHGTLLSRLLWLQGEYRLTRQDRVWNTMPATYGESLMMALLPLMFGAGLIDPEHTRAHQKATLIGWMPEHYPGEDQRWQKVSKRVRKLGFSDIDTPTSIAKGEASDMLTGPALLLRSACYRRSNITQNDCLGRTIVNVEAIVRCQHGNMLPAGFPGKLHLASPWYGAAWIDQPEKNAARLQPMEADQAQASNRVLLTNHWVRRKEDGQLYRFTKPDVTGLHTELLAQSASPKREKLQIKPGSWQHKVLSALAEVCHRESITKNEPLSRLDFNSNKAYKLAHKLNHRLAIDTDHLALAKAKHVSDLLELVAALR